MKKNTKQDFNNVEAVQSFERVYFVSGIMVRKFLCFKKTKQFGWLIGGDDCIEAFKRAVEEMSKRLKHYTCCPLDIKFIEEVKN